MKLQSRVTLPNYRLHSQPSPLWVERLAPLFRDFLGFAMGIHSSMEFVLISMFNGTDVI